MSEPSREHKLHAWPQDGIPIVFRKQPAEYEIVPPERFAEWESQMLDRVNLKVKAGAADGGLPSISWCGPGETNACDCDQV